MNEKLKELIIYIAQESKDDPNFVATKLNKILFMADFFYYGTTGKSISEAEYWHLQNGPTPKAMKSVLDDLEANKEIEIIERDHFGYSQKRVLPKRGANTSQFSRDEIEFVNQAIKSLWDKNGIELSNWTHTLIPWLITENKSDIPYDSVFVLYQLPIERDGFLWAHRELDRLSITD